MWAASYLKSGNTWLRAVWTAARTGAPPDLDRLDGRPIASDRHSFDTLLGVASSDLTADEIDLLRPRADEAWAAVQGGAGGLRKVHDALFPGASGEPIVSVGATRAAIYLVRDPRDVAVSLARQAGRPLDWAVARLCDPTAALGGDPGRLDEQLRQRLGTWSDHVRSWADQELFPVHVVRYEDCVRDPVATFGAALRFAGLDRAGTEVAAAVEQASFGRLQAGELEHGFREARGPGAFFRRGQVGTWRGELPAGLARRLEEEHADVMARFGYPP